MSLPLSLERCSCEFGPEFKSQQAAWAGWNVQLKAPAGSSAAPGPCWLPWPLQTFQEELLQPGFPASHTAGDLWRGQKRTLPAK